MKQSTLMTNTDDFGMHLQNVSANNDNKEIARFRIAAKMGKMPCG